MFNQSKYSFCALLSSMNHKSTESWRTNDVSTLNFTIRNFWTQYWFVLHSFIFESLRKKDFVPASFNTVTTTIQDDCLSCLCELETGSRECDGSELCKADIHSASKTCGPLRLTISYYYACGAPGKFGQESLSDAHQRCAVNTACAKRCVRVSCQNFHSRICL